MFDDSLRRLKDRGLAPLLPLVRPLGPMGLTLGGLVAGLASAGFAYTGMFSWAFSFWILNRLLDGLDGALARLMKSTSPFGGYVDILVDFLVYAAVPLGIVLGVSGGRSHWIGLSVMLGLFYVNAASWMYLSALEADPDLAGGNERPAVQQRTGENAESRAGGYEALPGKRFDARQTAISMPRGLVEGTETLVLYSLMLVFPQRFLVFLGILCAGVVMSIIQRIGYAWRKFR